nr:sigma-70 family RNA polymerase sigma factor [Sphingomonas hankookensis]
MAAFEAARPAMFGMAYRMLGTHADAEDVLQDVFLRWSKADRGAILNPAAWLMTACTRRSIDMLRSFARARTDYVGPWLPEPLAGTTASEDDELSFAVETAFLLLLERSSPRERAAFLLHEVFGLAHAEVGASLGTSEAASRKLVSRARAHVTSGRQRARLDPDRQRALLAAFQHAILTEDMAAFSAALANDVRLEADGGGKAAATSAPVEGRDTVLAFCAHARKWWRGYRWTVVRLATGYGAVLYDGPVVVATIWFGSNDGERISNLYIMRNPDKLRSVGVTAESS